MLGCSSYNVPATTDQCGAFPGDDGAAVQGCLSQLSFSALQVDRQCTDNCNKLQTTTSPSKVEPGVVREGSIFLPSFWKPTSGGKAARQWECRAPCGILSCSDISQSSVQVLCRPWCTTGPRDMFQKCHPSCAVVPLACSFAAYL